MNNVGVIRCVASIRTVARRSTFQYLQIHPCRKYTSSTEGSDPQLRGYPQLPYVSRQYAPAKGWQDELMRRNYGDTLHEHDELLSMWGPDIPPIPPQRALFQFTLAVFGFVGLGYLIKASVPEMPSVRREYPFSGLVTELGGLEENKARIENEVEEED